MNPSETSKLTPHQQAALQRKLLEAEVVAKSWTDEAFRSKLETDPKTALAGIGLPVPEGVSVIVKSEAPGHLQIILPAKPQIPDDMGDEELEAVAGGRNPALLGGGKCESGELVKKCFEKDGDGLIAGIISGAAFAVSTLFGNSWAYNN